MTLLGIDDLHVATGHHVLELAALAAARDVDPDKYAIGLGLQQQSVLAEDEDVVTMAAAAAQPVVARADPERLRTVLFATESGVDQSKSAGLFVHRLLGLPSTTRVVELKQACYGATAALQAALGIVARRPHEQVLVVASDEARYDLASAAEPTQGAGAAAMLVSADPALVAIDEASGLHTVDVDDFWRPNDRTTAIVDGALSTTAYLDALTGAWDDYVAQGGRPIATIDRLVYHQPFTRMAVKAHRHLAAHTGEELPLERTSASLAYGSRLGNAYAASLPIAIAALLDGDDDLSRRALACFSYGSGAVGELLSGTIVPGYRERLRGTTSAQLDARVPVDVARYEALHRASVKGSADLVTPRVTSAPFRFAGVANGARRYEVTGSA